MKKGSLNNIIVICLVLIIIALLFFIIYFANNILITNKVDISSNGDIEIIKVVSKGVEGDASMQMKPVFTKTSATFKTNLFSYGDSITYEVTVKNNGDKDVKLNKIIMSHSDNEKISFKTKGINKNDLLQSGHTQNFDVIVSYNEIKDMSKKIDTSVTVKLDYVENK